MPQRVCHFGVVHTPVWSGIRRELAEDSLNHAASAPGTLGAEVGDRVNARGMSGRHRGGEAIAEVRADELDVIRVVAVREDGVELRGRGVHLISRRVDQRWRGSSD